MMFSSHDRTIIRDIAKQVAEIAELPIMEQRRKLWTDHNDLTPGRPLILIFPEGGWGELMVDREMKCESKEAKNLEYRLRQRIYGFEHFSDDMVIEKDWPVNAVMHSTGWGLEPKQHARTAERGSWAFDPVIKESADLKKLRLPEITYDEKRTMENVEQMRELFGDILDVRYVGINRIGFHVMKEYTTLRGLSQVMMDMYENPGMLHDAMAFFEEGHRKMVQTYAENNLLHLNNDNTYQNTGGNGFTTQLPNDGFDPSRVRLCDMWGMAEAQEMAQVSPEHHNEFVLNYEKRLLEPFGLNGYGCCEDLTLKLDYVFTIPNIRRISISPWANVDTCAEKLKGNYIFSWKPNPAYIGGDFNPEVIRKNIQHTIDVAGEHGCVLEIVLKDTHTVRNEPERFDIWSKIVRELVDTYADKRGF